jgi:hypothetical protein
MKLYQELAKTNDAYNRCIETGNKEWEDKWNDKINMIMESSPSGSGIDCGTKFDREASNDKKLVFYVSFHHMNDNGMYDGWTEHIIKAIPSLLFGFTLTISGKDRNYIKEYLADVYNDWLNSDML